MSIRYQVRLADPNRHEFEVSIIFETDGVQDVTLTLPAWIPGSYMIRDFARNLLDIRAQDQQGEGLALDKTDKQSWRLTARPGLNRVTYRVYAFDESVRSAYFDNTRAYFNGTSLFLRVVGKENGTHLLDIERPQVAAASSWRVATSMPALQVDDRGYGSYQCSNYDQLVDHPLEIADFGGAGFDLNGVDHQLVFVDAPAVDAERIAKDVAPICAEHAAMFGELPVERYLFMTLATAAGYGGLEHRDCTSLVCKRSDLVYPNTTGIEKGYRTFLALCSHEYFHLWNVKRIRPGVFAAGGLDAEVHTELLWAFEGITSYYDELALARAGVIDRNDYLDMLAPSLSRYLRNPGRLRQSVAESSFDAWTKFYKQDENAVNAIVSYYNKGALVALGLDLLIRTRSNDALTLDDLMRRLWQVYGKTGMGVPERAIEKDLAEMLAEPVEDFFSAYVYGTDELPLEGWLAQLGVGLVRRAAVNAKDQGGYVEKPTEAKDAPVSLQAMFEDKQGSVQLTRVTQDGSAQLAGLAPGDQLLAIDGERCTAANLPELLNRKRPGEQVTVTYFRRSLLKQTSLTLSAAADDTCDLYWLDSQQLENPVVSRREAWLSSSRRGG